MTRTPQVIITETPDGTLIAEHYTNGMRHQTPITSIESIRRILASQHRFTAQTIGLDGIPTSAQVRHWETHEEPGIIDPDCTFCLATEMGQDTSYAAFRRARKLLLAERNRHSRKRDPSLHTVGDGSIKVRILPKRDKHISHRPITLADDTDLFELAE